MQKQNYKNHARYVPLYHFITLLGVIVLIAGSAYKLCRNYQMGIGGLMTPALLLLFSIVVFLVAFFARSFALKAQDRAIRAEENLRHFVITGKLLDNKLSMGQIIALRFASDNEFVNLAIKAAQENMKPSEIKQAIQNWKEDNYRV